MRYQHSVINIGLDVFPWVVVNNCYSEFESSSKSLI